MATTVKSGDTLWAIAQRVLGDGSRWRELLGPSGLPSNFDPRTLQIGTVIKTAAEVAPKPAPKPAAKAAPKPTTTSKLSVPVQPGLAAEQEADRLALQKFIADQLAELEQQRIDLQEGRDADARRLTEAQLAANPADFVAYELYKRSLVDQGFEIQGEVRTDAEIQNLFELALNLEKTNELNAVGGGTVDLPGGGQGIVTGIGRDIGQDRIGRLGEDIPEGLFGNNVPNQEGVIDPDVLGIGQFGVELPTTGSISRSDFGDFGATDIGILSSFLKGGVDTGEGDFQGINPEDFFQTLQEGFVPTLGSGQRTQFAF